MTPSQQKVNVVPATEPWWSFPVSIRQDAAGTHVRVAWRRLILLLLGTGVAAWLALAAAVFLWVKYQRGFSDVQIGYILFPHRWKEYGKARGDFYIEQAKEEIADQNWVQAIHHLRVGVAASPSNTEGRLVLSQFFTIIGRIELAQRTLVEGLPYARDDTEYLKSLFGFLLQYQEDDEVRRIATELLPATPTVTPRNQLIALAAATANFYRGAYDAAEKLIADYSILQTKDGRMLSARIGWERGNREQALAQLKRYTTEFPEDEEFYNQLAAYNRELGDFAAVAKFAFLRELANPRSASARIDLIQAYRNNNNTDQVRRAVDEFVADFARDVAALTLLANAGTENGDPALARRIYDHLKGRQLETDAAGLMVMEAHVVAGEFRAALDFALELSQTRPEWMQKFLGVVNGLQAVAYFGLGQREDGELFLSHFMSQPNLRAEHFTAIANRLVAIGAKEPARKVLAHAVETNLRNQAALTRLIDLDLDRPPSAELAANLKRLLAMRRPAPDVLQKARHRLGSDRFLFVAGRDELLAAVQEAIDHSPAPVVSRAAAE